MSFGDRVSFQNICDKYFADIADKLAQDTNVTTSRTFEHKRLPSKGIRHKIGWDYMAPIQYGINTDGMKCYTLMHSNVYNTKLHHGPGDLLLNLEL